jgi:hypothetical protein
MLWEDSTPELLLLETNDRQGLLTMPFQVPINGSVVGNSHHPQIALPTAED